MQAHRTTITVGERREVVLRLPPDFPIGEAEVIVLASEVTVEPSASERLRVLEEMLDSLPPAPVLPLSAIDRG